MAIRILEIEQNTEEWFAQRRNKVTGSIADVLIDSGLEEALRRNDKSGNWRGNYYTKRGHDLEPKAIYIYEQVYETQVERPGFIVNDDHPNAGCSPDGIDREWLLEVKCFAEKRHCEITKLRDIPFKIMSQLQFNMMISGLKKARLIMYNPELKDVTKAFCVIEVTANPAIQENMARKLRNELQPS